MSTATITSLQDTSIQKSPSVSDSCPFVSSLSNHEMEILSCFLFHCGPFLHTVIKNINIYRSECSLCQVTPVKRLSRYTQIIELTIRKRVRRLKKDSLPQDGTSNPSGFLAPELFIDQEILKGGLIPTLLDVPNLTGEPIKCVSVEENTVPVAERKETTPHFCLADSASPPQSTIFLDCSSQLTPDAVFAEMEMGVIGSRKHEKKWTDVSPRELSLFLASMLNETSEGRFFANSAFLPPRDSPQGVDGLDGSVYLGEFRGLSRDRSLQIRRTLHFPEIGIGMDDIVDKYNQSVSIDNQNYEDQSPNAPFPNDPRYWKSVLSDYLVCSEVCIDLPQALLYMELRKVQLDEKQQSFLRLFRKGHRYVEVVFWFVCQLYLNLAYKSFSLSQHEISKTEYLEMLIRGLYWVNMTSLSQVLLEDVHYLVRVKRKSNKQKERKLCCVCSPKGSTSKKRTEFLCLKCNLPFCNSVQCFTEYHRNQGMRFYRYANGEHSSVCSFY